MPRSRDRDGFLCADDDDQAAERERGGRVEEVRSWRKITCLASACVQFVTRPSPFFDRAVAGVGGGVASSRAGSAAPHPVVRPRRARLDAEISLRRPGAAPTAGDMVLAELPGRGLGAAAGRPSVSAALARRHLRRRRRARRGTLEQHPPAGVPPLRPAHRAFRSLAPQLSFNFGSGNGWSYLSGGIGQSKWAITPEGLGGQPAGRRAAEDDQLRRRRALVHQAAPRVQLRHPLLCDQPRPRPDGRPASPRTTLLVIDAGSRQMKLRIGIK